MILILGFLVLATYISFRIFGTESRDFEHLVSFVLSLKIVGIALILLSIYYIYLFWRRNRYRKSLRNTVKTEIRSDIPLLTERLNKLEKDIDKSLLESGIKERVRQKINQLLEPSYSLRLTISGAPGLAEVNDPRRTIDTSAQRQLDYMMKNMPGGSIGIAGQRGSGKTTLIQAYCGSKRIIAEIKGKKILPVFVSAPVEYQSRDFILYLFASVCRSILKMSNIVDGHTPLGEKLNGVPHFSPKAKKLFGSISTLVTSAGVILIIIGILLAFLIMPYSESSNAISNSKIALQNDSLKKSNSIIQEPIAIKLIKTLGIKPNIIFSLGTVLTVLGLISFLLYRKIKQQDIDSMTLMDITNKISEDQSAHINDAKKWLTEIKFQQSFTTGWSGNLKLPIGFEGGLNRAVTFAQNQMSNPEIVSAFTEFVNSIPDEFQVIVGIDELDKLESDEQAQKFLNEIKSIFGQPRCFYLISVSENAMSNFERRGLPFRDVFDSSFDSIIYVDYLTFETAQKVLERRVIGRPIPFFSLSFCLSGGLARDLIRSFRSLMELRDNNNTSNDLSTLVNAIIKSELRSKIRAIRIAAKRIEQTDVNKQFLEILYLLEAENATSDSLIDLFQTLYQMKTIFSDSTSSEEQKNKNEKIIKLKNELAAYVYFSVTLFQFFNNFLDESVLKQAVKDGSIDELARVRQTLSIDTAIAISRLTKFREKHILKIPSFLNLG
jgi:hypothetical protein